MATGWPGKSRGTSRQGSGRPATGTMRRRTCVPQGSRRRGTQDSAKPAEAPRSALARNSRLNTPGRAVAGGEGSGTGGLGSRSAAAATGGAAAPDTAFPAPSARRAAR